MSRPTPAALPTAFLAARLRRLTAAGTTEERLRKLFGVVALLTLALAVGGVAATRGTGELHRAAAIAGLFALAVRYARALRSGRLGAAGDALDVVVLVLASTASGPEHLLGLVYIGSFFRVQFGGRRRLAATTVLYFGGHLLSLVLPHAATPGAGYAVADAVLQLPTYALAVGTTYVLARTGRGYDAARGRERDLGAERARLAAALARRDADRWYQTLIESTSDVVTVMERDTTVRFQTPSVARVLGYEPAELVGTRLIDLVHPDDRDWVWAGYVRGLRRPGVADHPILCRWRHRDGTWRWVENTRNNLLHDERMEAVVLNSRDVSDRVALEEQLTHRAFHDTLTGLPNRALFADRLERALALAALRGGRLAVVFLDLDDFKTVNDSLGHGAGDAVLRTAATRLAAVVEPGDTVARFGGDEFAVLLESAASGEAAAATARALLAALQRPHVVGGRRLALAGSAGIALATGRESGTEELLRNADVALYAAKADGKGRFRTFEPAMHAAAVARLELEDELRRALSEGEFVLHYQPVVRTGTGELAGVEALVRWRHPDRGLLGPAAFVGLAEQAGLIAPLGSWILREAVRQAAAWRAAGIGGEALWVSVNLSVEQLADPALTRRVAAALEAHGLPADRLVLELTESAVMRDVAAATARLAELKAHGVRVALDDFGEGHSSLAHVAELPLDMLKIPKSFVDPLAHPDGNGALALAAVQLARAFGLETVAEGIETPIQHERVLALGCDLAQGYLFARPVEPARLAELAGERAVRRPRAAVAPRAASAAS